MPFDSLNSNRVTATKLYNKNQASVKSRDRDTLIEQSPRGKKGVQKMLKKKQKTRQEPPYLTPATLTTEPLLPWLITSLNLSM